MASEQTFIPFPKIPRLFRECVITEKLDGTNAAVVVTKDGEVHAQSRNRIITPEQDNFGFAAFVKAREEEFRISLGVGHHFGEWWGPGIQRGYGRAEKWFSLFNTTRWGNHAEWGPKWPDRVDTVPFLAAGMFSTELVKTVLELLQRRGSVASPGFMRPEGIIVFHVAAGQSFKVTLDEDGVPKSAAATALSTWGTNRVASERLVAC